MKPPDHRLNDQLWLLSHEKKKWSSLKMSGLVSGLFGALPEDPGGTAGEVDSMWIHSSGWKSTSIVLSFFLCPCFCKYELALVSTLMFAHYLCKPRAVAPVCEAITSSFGAESADRAESLKKKNMGLNFKVASDQCGCNCVPFWNYHVTFASF